MGDLDEFYDLMPKLRPQPVQPKASRINLSSRLNVGLTYQRTVGIRQSNLPVGTGLFALTQFEPGDEVVRFDGRTLTFAETLALGEQANPLQIGHDVYILTEGPAVRVNHSCSPNTGLRSNIILMALKPISAGEEIFFDYSTSMAENHWQMRCLCGSSNCRKVVTDFAMLPREVRMRYLDLGIVQPFIAMELG